MRGGRRPYSIDAIITCLICGLCRCITMSSRARSFAPRRARHACQDRTTSPTSVGRARHAAAFFFLFGWRCVRVQGHADAAQRICSGVRSEATSRHPHCTRPAASPPPFLALGVASKGESIATPGAGWIGFAVRVIGRDQVVDSHGVRDGRLSGGSHCRHSGCFLM